MTFDDFNLNTPLLSALSELGFTQPTPIQEKTFSVVMSGRDIVGIAQTGTGKTLAYLLPLLRMHTFSKQKEPRILIIVPTRELVNQMVEELKKLTAFMTIRIAGIYGGVNINTQKITVGAGLDLIVATPGRLVDLALNNALNLKYIKHLVIDEVDEMLNLGFRTQLTNLLDLLPRKRQNLMFSATMTEEVDNLINIFFNAPLTIEITRAGTPIARIDQFVYHVPNFTTKLNLLERLISSDETMTKVLIFGPSKRIADQIHQYLQANFPDQFEIIHSNKSQNYRMSAVQQFADGTKRGLIATDILARGVDVSEVTHVINVDTPDTAETYIHRIGRTGRADRDGCSILFVTEKEKVFKVAIEELMEKEITVLPLPDDLIISTHLTDDERFSGPEKNYTNMPKYMSGAFHEKTEKNKKVNLGNDRVRIMAKKYTKPISKGGGKKKRK